MQAVYYQAHVQRGNLQFALGKFRNNAVDGLVQSEGLYFGNTVA